ncbi:MAG: class III extradiol dioxygenase subunit B-like domain-containing protein [Bacillota bacterium]|nr:class III extradiol dioxygenase subunit B-like domain-containing protein [Bacillota bacterium]
MSIIMAGISPHPALLIPEVGGREISKVRNTVESLKTLAGRIAALRADTVVFITPHGPMFRDAVVILAEEKLEGDFKNFGAPQVKLQVKNDLELVSSIAEESEKEQLDLVLLKKDNSYFLRDETTLDHGITVPLYYLQEAGAAERCVAVTFAMLSFSDLFRFGIALKRAVDNSGRKVAVVASGDLSHRLTSDAPAGYSPRGQEYDQKVVDFLKTYQVEKLLSIDPELVSAAGECGLRSFIIMLGSLFGQKIRSEILSYEGPFGVGYLVAAFTPEYKED